MDDLSDKELEEKESLPMASRAVLPFEIPDHFINIPGTTFNVISTYLPAVIAIATVNRKLPVKEILENAQNMFRSGAQYRDDYWMQHCAATMRELVSFVSPDDFKRAFRSIPEVTDPQVSDLFAYVINACSYLSSVVHFRDDSKVGDAEKLYPSVGYGQKSHQDFLREEPIFFEKVCIDLVYTLHHLFYYHCSGNSAEAELNDSNETT
jgi:hypothetical protein